MLKSLHIKNMAVISEIEFDFSSGLTVFTGETGAGKSVITDCIKFLICQKISRDLLRTGETKGLVSAVFSDLSDYTVCSLNELGFDVSEREINLERIISADGRSSCRIDGRGVSQQIMRKVGSLLITVHGQNESLRLADESARLSLIDTYSSSDDLLNDYSLVYEEWADIRRQITNLIRDSAELSRRQDMLQFQIKEITAAKLKAGEEESLVAERSKLQSAERIKKFSDSAARTLYANEKGITASSMALHAAEMLSKVADVVPEYNDLAARLRSCTYELDDISSELQRIAVESDLNSDPSARLDEIESRLALITRLKRKYGSTVEEIIDFGNNASSELERIESSEIVMDELISKQNALQALLEVKAKSLTEARKSNSIRIEKEVCETLRFLDMPKVRFSVMVGEKNEFSESGKDQIDFLIAANAGEPLLPLEKSASGGELSRVMLALKCAVSEADKTDTLIFDEVDTGVSGKTSGKIGIKLKQASASSQILAVTHSAQIASLAHHHLLVSKYEKAGRTESQVVELDEDGRIDELARILGGINVSESQRLAAIDMINEGKTY